MPGLVFLASSLLRGLDPINHTGDLALVSSTKRNRSCVWGLERCDVSHPRTHDLTRFNINMVYVMLGMERNSKQTSTESFGCLEHSLGNAYRFVIIDSSMVVICIHGTLRCQRVS